jgi:hypothetical protein
VSRATPVARSVTPAPGPDGTKSAEGPPIGLVARYAVQLLVVLLVVEQKVPNNSLASS